MYYQRSLSVAPVVQLEDAVKELSETGKRVKVLWQEPDALTFVARGREYRSEFHINPSDEIMYMIRGQMNLHIRKEDGSEEIVVVPEGGLNFTPAGMPHSPRFPPDAFLLVSERIRREGEADRFQWYCPSCDALLHEETFTVSDYRADPVSKAYANFFDSEENRTCDKCGNTMPRPDGV
ncbi:3-hydroxyanthranilate 3,4-dioxygenase [Amorphus suaedae]